MIDKWDRWQQVRDDLPISKLLAKHSGVYCWVCGTSCNLPASPLGSKCWVSFPQKSDSSFSPVGASTLRWQKDFDRECFTISLRTARKISETCEAVTTPITCKSDSFLWYLSLVLVGSVLFKARSHDPVHSVRTIMRKNYWDLSNDNFYYSRMIPSRFEETSRW